MPIKLLLVDDAEVIRRSIRSLLADESQIEIVGEATSHVEALEIASRLKPDVVLMDLHLPDRDETDPSSIKASFAAQGCQIIAISIFSDDETQALAKDLGAALLLEKPMLGTELLPTILQMSQRGILSPNSQFGVAS
jgi:DNA-binding NarL/FixJ family response regulator